MRKIIAWISRNQALLLIGFVVLGVTGTFLFRYLTRYLEETRTTPLPNSSLPQFQEARYVFENLTYSGGAPEFPDRLSLIKNTKPSVNPSEEAAKLAQDLEFSPHEKIENLWLSPDGSQSVRYDPAAQQMRIALGISTIAPLADNYSEQRAITQAKEYLADRGLPLYSQSLAEVNYLTANEHGQTSLRRDAELLEVDLTPQIENIPIVFEANTRSHAILTLDPDYNVIKATFSPLYFAPEKGETLLLIPIDQAVENIKNGSYTVLNVAQQTGELTLLSRFSQVDLRQVYLEYRFLPEFNQLYPYYRFVGVAQSPETDPHEDDEDEVQMNQSTIEIVTPAINTEENAQ